MQNRFQFLFFSQIENQIADSIATFVKNISLSEKMNIFLNFTKKTGLIICISA